MNNLSLMKNCPGMGGARYVICDSRVILMDKLGGWGNTCTKRVSSSSVTEFYRCLCAKPSLRSRSN